MEKLEKLMDFCVGERDKAEKECWRIRDAATTYDDTPEEQYEEGYFIAMNSVLMKIEELDKS